jgi:hypothetical protein
MADVPDYIDPEKHRDLTGGRGREIWVRRSLMGLFAALPVVALFNVFGQHPETTTRAGAAATLELRVPGALRGGDVYQARFRIAAHRDIRSPVLVLGPGWLEGSSLNTDEPTPKQETSRDGRVALHLGDIPPGKRAVQYLQLQVNPTTVGRRDLSVWLYDANTPLASIHRKLTIFP